MERIRRWRPSRTIVHGCARVAPAWRQGRSSRFGVKANVVLSGAVRARCRSAATTSRSAVARRTSRRASTTLSIRPRPTAPANRPTVRSQSGRSGRSSIGRSAPAAVPAPSRASLEADKPLDWSSAARATACQAACTSPGSGSSDRSAASATVSVADDPCRVTPNVGSTSDEAPNDAHGSPASGCVPLNPRPPSRTGPPSPSPSSGAPSTRTASARTPRQASAASTKRSGPAASTAQARPTPTIERSAAGWSQSAASRSSARAAANRSIGSSGAMASVAVPRLREPAPRDAASSAVTAVAIAASGRRRPTVDDGHGVMAEWSAIRASGTPTLRSRSARSVG